MKNKSDVRFWMSQGVILGFLAAGLLATILTGVLSNETFHKYQTFFGALVAVLGALATILILNLQINQADRHEEDRRERRSFASRSVMPTALSVLSEYANGCVRQLVRLHEGAQVGEPITWPTNVAGRLFPEMPSEPIPVLKEVVENSTRPVAKYSLICLAICRL